MVSIEIDQKSFDHLNKQMEVLKQGTPRSLYSAITKIGYKIKAEAQMRLRGKNHIVTSRLRNSLFVKTKSKHSLSYQDNKGGSFISDLRTITIKENDIAIGTNVIYAEYIENMDSYLQWATLNVDISKSIQDDMKKTMDNVMKFGLGVIPAVTTK